MANWKADIYTWTCGIDLVFINELEEISGIDLGARPCRHRPASLNPANEAARGGWIAALDGLYV